MKEMPLHVELYAIYSSYRRMLESESKEAVVSFWEDFFCNLSNCGVRYVTYFPFQCEVNGLYNKYHPFSDKGWDKKWWRELRFFMRLARRFGIILVPVGFSKYQDTIFRMVGSRMELRYANRLARIYARIYKNYPKVAPLYFRLSNECTHSDWNHGVDVALRHEAWYEEIKKYIKLENIICNTSHSDFAKLEEPHLYIGYTRMYKPSELGSVVLTDETDGGWYTELIPKSNYYKYVGNANIQNLIIYGEWGDEEYNRTVWNELHCMHYDSLNGPIEPGCTMTVLERITSCGWKKWVLSTDGTDVGDEVIPGWPFKNLTKLQIRQFAKCAWARSILNKIDVRIAELPKEIFFINDDGIVEEDFGRLDFSRLKVYKKVWDNLYNKG